MMNGMSAHGGRNTTYSSAVRPGCDHKGWALGMMCLRNNWTIQLFVLLCLIFQIVLAVLGSRRKISGAMTIRLVIWASYSLASYVSTLALGKLASVSLNKSEEEYDTELKALLAPLTLLLMGNPDSITAYSVEDNWLGLRRVFNLVTTFPLVLWILVRSWKTSIRMILYFPMFVAGIIEYGETIWALYSVHVENTNIIRGDFPVEKVNPIALNNLPEDVPHLEIFLKAYDRFNGLKPHLGDWLKNRFFMLYPPMSIDEYSPDHVFLITEMELGFMYDVLYTKAPILYTKSGITLRVISYFSFLLTFGGFMGLFFDELLRDPYVIYTFGLLIGVMFRETYQLLKLFYSDWVIIRFHKLYKNPIVLKFLKLLVKQSLKKKRWSNRIWQFDFLSFCQSDRRPWFFRILNVCGMAEKFRKYLATNSVPIPGYLKELLLEDMEKLETKRDSRPFTERGQWTLDAHKSLDKLQWSIEMAFDRSIIIWHIATHICNKSCYENSDRSRASKLISDYMMFLLVLHPDMLPLTPADITFSDAYSKFQTFLKQIPEKRHDRESILEILSGTEYVQKLPSERILEPVINRGWKVVEEAQRLARELKDNENRWELISSVWVEMLCFVAYNCQQYHHMKLLRRGGDIITHVWLLLSHKTNLFSTFGYMDRNIEIE